MARVALYLQDKHEIREGMEYVKYAEQRGFEAVWQAESRLVRDAIVPMAAFAAATSRIKVGSGVLNNWTRNIGLLAATLLTLDDLGMAAGAAELLAPLEVLEMGLMVEDDLAEGDLAFEKPAIVTAGPEAAFVLDLGPRLGFDVEAGPVAPDHDQPFDLGPEERPHARRIVADLARDGLMARRLPALEEGFHVVAGRAEVRRRRELDGDDEERQEDQRHADEEDTPLAALGFRRDRGPGGRPALPCPEIVLRHKNAAPRGDN